MKQLIFYTEHSASKTELLGMQLVLTKQNGQPDFGKEFGMTSRKGKTDKPLG